MIETPVNRREARKRQTRQRIQQEALRLFLANGFEATSVEQIATAADVSHMTFFRNFPTKESVLDDDYDPLIAALIRQRPAEEDGITAISRALVMALQAMPPDELTAVRIRTELILKTRALRARLWENQYATQELFAHALAARTGLSQPSFGMKVVAAAALGTITTALTSWVDGPAGRPLSEVVDEGFGELRNALPG